MGIKIFGDQLWEITPAIEEALDTALAGTLNLQQAKLSRANPKDTGRMSSSWFIGHNTPRRDYPVNWADRGRQITEIEKYEGKITFDGTWYISNNVPYAQRICYDYEPAAPKAQKDWFTSISNQTIDVFKRQWDKVKP